MSGLDNMQTRINYSGGKRQVDRMNEDKLKSLKKALLYSYQSATALLADGREFRCLINPDKLKNEYDNKIISIPFKDICLNADRVGKTSEGEVEIGIKAGDVFTWKENNSDWLVYLQRLEETAYFRAEIRRCRYTVEINGVQYKVYACGPREEEIVWNKVKKTQWNDLNYSLEMYITKDENTEEYFHRFEKLELNNLPWEVQAVDNMSVEGVIIVALKEDYKNTIADTIEEEKSIKKQEEEEQKAHEPKPEVYIEGDELVFPYEERDYSIINAEGGYWSITGTKAKIMSQDDQNVRIYVSSGRSGSFELKYTREEEEDVIMTVTIDSL